MADLKVNLNLDLFNRWLRTTVKSQPVTILFTKKDGSDRVINCTTSETLIPVAETVASDSKKERKVNNNVFAVYDLEAQGWRSFRWDSIKQVTFKL